MQRPLEAGGRQWWKKAQQPKLGRVEARSSRLLRTCGGSQGAGEPGVLRRLPLGRAKREKRTRTMRVGNPDVKRNKNIQNTVCYFTSVFPCTHLSPGSIPLYKWHIYHIRGTETGPRFCLAPGVRVGGQLPCRVILLLPLVEGTPIPNPGYNTTSLPRKTSFLSRF